MKDIATLVRSLRGEDAGVELRLDRPSENVWLYHFKTRDDAQFFARGLRAIVDFTKAEIRVVDATTRKELDDN